MMAAHEAGGAFSPVDGSPEGVEEPRVTGTVEGGNLETSDLLVETRSGRWESDAQLSTSPSSLGMGPSHVLALARQSRFC